MKRFIEDNLCNGIGYSLEDGYPHEMRAAACDDWITETNGSGRTRRGLNGDMLVWNHVTQRRHELSSMGIRVNPETLQKQLEMSKQLDFLKFPYHQAILKNEIPLSIGGGIGQGRTLMLLLGKAHLGEVTVTAWPKILKKICAKKIFAFWNEQENERDGQLGRARGDDRRTGCLSLFQLAQRFVTTAESVPQELLQLRQLPFR